MSSFLRRSLLIRKMGNKKRNQSVMRNESAKTNVTLLSKEINKANQLNVDGCRNHNEIGAEDCGNCDKPNASQGF
jgi:hypothetical protein